MAAGISLSLASFHFNEAALQSLLRSPSGGVARDLARRAIAVESAAKQNATGRPGPNVISDRLRGSITWKLGVDAVSLYADIGTNVHYAPYVERRYPYLLPALDAARL